MARISGIEEGVVFAPFHYGYFDSDGLDGHPRAANELTITEWDPASKQPLYKVGAVRVTKIADAGGTHDHRRGGTGRRADGGLERHRPQDGRKFAEKVGGSPPAASRGFARSS